MGTPVEEFDSSLKALLSEKRLSQSKTTALTEHALKHMEYDAQLVSSLYRTHKTLAPTNKIWSLYVFDSIARAAHRHATKRKLPVKVEPGKGNAATFLLKLEGVLDGLFEDLASEASKLPEIKEKMKKILDLWVKGATFPPPVLARLGELVVRAAGGQPNKPAIQVPTSNYTSSPQQPIGSNGAGFPGSSNTPPFSPVTGGQSAPGTVASALPPQLLALLAQGQKQAALNQQLPNTAGASGPPPPPSISPVTPIVGANGVPQVSPAQLILLQQLAIAGGLIKPSATGSPLAGPPPRDAPSSSEYNHGSPPRRGDTYDDNSYNGRRADPRDRGPLPRRNDDYNDTERDWDRDRSRDDHFEDDRRRKRWRDDDEYYDGPGGRGGRGRGRGDHEDGGYRGGRGRGRGRGRGGDGFSTWKDKINGDDYGDPRRGGFRGRGARGGSDRWGGGGRAGFGNGNVGEDDDVPYQRSSRSRSPEPARNPNAGPSTDSPGPLAGSAYSFNQASNSAAASSGSFHQQDEDVDDFGRQRRPTDPPQAPAPSPNMAIAEPPFSPTQSRPSRSAGPVRAIQTFESQTPNELPPASSLSANTTDNSGQDSLLPILPGESIPYLNQFDFTAFDFSEPSSWELLAKSFQITNGYVPDQAELMGIVMMAMQTMQQMQMMQAQQWAAANGTGGDESLWYGNGAVASEGGAGVDGSVNAQSGSAITASQDAASSADATTSTPLQEGQTQAVTVTSASQNPVPSGQPALGEKGDVADPRRLDPRRRPPFIKAVVEAEGDGDMSMSPSDKSTPLTPLSEL